MLTKRQFVTESDPDDGSDSWWYSDEAYIVKWAVLGSIFLVFFVWIVGGHFHARSRMKKGLPLLAYHRWLVPRHRRPGWQPAYPMYNGAVHRPYYQQPPQQYPEPPPLYDGYGMPPVYAPPNKVPLVSEHPPSTSQAGPASQESGVLPPQPAAQR